MILNKLFFIIICLSFCSNSFGGVFDPWAMNLNEIMKQEFLQPHFDCTKAKNADEIAICADSFGGAFNPLPIFDNFYSSYYALVVKNVDTKERDILKNISLEMLKNRKKCPFQIHFNDDFDKKAFDDKNKENIKNGYEPIDLNNLNSKYVTTLGINCYEYVYLKAFRQISAFIYDKHKPLFEKIFYPNPKEFYQLIMTKKQNLPYEPLDYDAQTINELIDKAAKEGLIARTAEFFDVSNLDGMLAQINIEPSSTCDEALDSVWCDQALYMEESDSKLTIIMDNFYFSYYKILMQSIDAKDKNKLESIVSTISQKQQECYLMANDPQDLPNIRPIFELTNCMQYEYFKSFKQLTDFIYNNPQYKHIFDKIFAPNAKEYYELIKSSKDLRKIIDKAAGEELIDNMGKLIEK